MQRFLTILTWLSASLTFVACGPRAIQESRAAKAIGQTAEDDAAEGKSRKTRHPVGNEDSGDPINGRREEDHNETAIEPSTRGLPLASEARQEEMRAFVDSVIQPLVKGNAAFGVELIYQGERYFFGYGSPTPGGAAPNERSFFESGSMGKTFVGTVLGQMVHEGKVSLEDPVEKYLEPSVHIPSAGGRKITLLDLATHYSGLLNSSDPQIITTREELLRSLDGMRLEFTPGEKYSYSNLGTSLLAYALANVDGTTWDVMMENRIFGPMGMNETDAALRKSQQARWVQSYAVADDTADQALAFSPHNALDAEGPSGGTFITAYDMGIYVASQLGLLNQSLFEPLVIAQTPRRVMYAEAPEAFSTGFFWDVEMRAQGGVRSVGKSGGWNGFSTHMQFDHSTRTGIIVLHNRFDYMVSQENTLGTVIDASYKLLEGLSP